MDPMKFEIFVGFRNFEVDQSLEIPKFAVSRHLAGGPAEMLSGFGFFQG